jgi:hypothetical protein
MAVSRNRAAANKAAAGKSAASRSAASKAAASKAPAAEAAATEAAATRAAFGDFQTPRDLAAAVCALLAGRGLRPASILEPTCGKGNFLVRALESFPSAGRVVGVEINPEYVSAAKTAVRNAKSSAARVEVRSENFFGAAWIEILETLPDPLLVIGNPPWVTNAALGALGSGNLPAKSNFQKHAGFDAITGKSNFDISEWMLIRILEWVQRRDATVAMLCKTAVARKVLAHAWKSGLPISRADIYPIDALKHFEAAVDACLFVCASTPETAPNYDCLVHSALAGDPHPALFGYRDRRLVADVPAYERTKHLAGAELYKWRSGIKHDCASVMELYREGDRFRNGLGELVDLEDACLYPMLKSSEVANGLAPRPSRWMLVTQRSIGEDTAAIAKRAPKTWRYLERHLGAFERRGSSIYRNRPPFSIFGVGEYSFSRWKVAISGFYKNLRFTVVGPCAGKPVMLDDTVYFIACASEPEAVYLASLLNSNIANAFFKAFCFPDAKRPVTTELLRRLDIPAVARELGSPETLAGFGRQPPKTNKDLDPRSPAQGQPLLFQTE